MFWEGEIEFGFFRNLIGVVVLGRVVWKLKVLYEYFFFIEFFLIYFFYFIFVLCLNRDIVIFRNKVGLYDFRYFFEVSVFVVEIFRFLGNFTCWCLIGGECWWNFLGVGRSLLYVEFRFEKRIIKYYSWN